MKVKKEFKSLTTKEKIKGFLVLGLVVFVLFVIFSPNDDQPMQETPKPTQATTPTATVSATASPEHDEELANSVYRGAFVSSCSESGEVSESKCRCMFNYMYDTYGIEKIVEAASDSKLSQMYGLEAALQCVDVK